MSVRKQQRSLGMTSEKKEVVGLKGQEGLNESQAHAQTCLLPETKGLVRSSSPRPPITPQVLKATKHASVGRRTDQ
jgi:hypothetical protein